MKKSNESEALRLYLRSLSISESQIMRNRIAIECGVKITTVNNWCSGLCKIPFLAKKKIEEVTESSIFTNLEK